MRAVPEHKFPTSTRGQCGSAESASENSITESSTPELDFCLSGPVHGVLGHAIEQYFGTAPAALTAGTFRSYRVGIGSELADSPFPTNYPPKG